MTLFPRSAGILLHPTSLPGPYGIGDLGDAAYRFIDWLALNGQTLWQVLPLTPTGYADSPYQSLSAFAGNPNLVSLDRLVGDGWLTQEDLADAPNFPSDTVDYGAVIPYHDAKIRLAHQRFEAQADESQRDDFDSWCDDNADWLEDYALFAAIKASHDLKPWTEWPRAEALRDAVMLEEAPDKFGEAMDEQRFRQWIFFRQWDTLKTYANNHGIKIIGDLPIFVAHDSADVWANPDLFYLDEQGNPTVVAGVPPDYFSPTGQLWGNPLYRWDVMKSNGYEWWLRRLQAMLSMVDYVRIDHFRGFAAYWRIPGDAETAVHGEWILGPGTDFFTVVKKELGELPIIAEDLGVITEDVEKLRDDFNLPGMKVLQFAWSEPDNVFLPHNHIPNSICYTGTHDNNTTVGWWQEETHEGERNFVQEYNALHVNDIHWVLIQIGMRSCCSAFIAPLQDVMGLDASGRMNRPGDRYGWWKWRFSEEEFDQLQHERRLGHFTWLYQRRADQRERVYGDQATARRATGTFKVTKPGAST